MELVAGIFEAVQKMFEFLLAGEQFLPHGVLVKPINTAGQKSAKNEKHDLK